MLAGQVEDLPDSLRSLPTTGLLSGERPRDIEDWIDATLGAGLIAESPDQYRTLSLTFLGREVMTGQVRHVEMTPPGARPAPRAARPGAPRLVRHSKVRQPARAVEGLAFGPGVAGRTRRLRDLDPEGAADWLKEPARETGPGDDSGERDYREASLEKALRSWRVGVSRQEGVRPYLILHDRTLLAIAAARPRTPEDLLQMPGIGPAKVEKYGTAILALVAGIR
jgi:superfamily II DNA helicase RecQ